MTNDSAIKAATVSGFRQGLEQCAAQLRAQAAEWRAEAVQLEQAQLAAADRKKSGQAKASAKRQAHQHRAGVDQWCTSVERIAALIEAEARKRLQDENLLRSQALADAAPRGIARKLLAALRSR